MISYMAYLATCGSCPNKSSTPSAFTTTDKVTSSTMRNTTKAEK